MYKHHSLLSAGDVVNEDDVLLQIETDKVTIDVRYTETKPGKIKEFLVSEDDTVTVGQQVCIIDKGNTEGADEGTCQLRFAPCQPHDKYKLAVCTSSCRKSELDSRCFQPRLFQYC